MKYSNHAYAICTGFLFALILLPTSVMCFQDPDDDLAIKFLRISPGCEIELLRKKVPLVTRNVPESYRDAIVTPGPNQEQLIREAFRTMPEFVCKAVNKVVFVNRGSANARVDAKYPDLVIVSFPTEDRLAFSNEGPKLIEIFSANSGPARESKLREYIKERLGDVWPSSIKTLIHEATHSAVNLLEKSKTEEPSENHCSSYEKNFVSRALSGDPGFVVHDTDYYPDLWDSGAKSDAKKIIEKTGLQEGLFNEWCRMQKRFAEANLSLDYYLEKRGIDDDALPMKGFFSEYGQQDPAEEIAEIVSLIQFNHIQTQPQLGIKVVGDIENLDPGAFEELKNANAAWDFSWSDFSNVELKYEYFNVCKEDFQRTTKNSVSPDLAATYTKMNFVRDLGFVSEEAYKSCIGDGKIGLQGSDEASRNGFHRLEYESGEYMYRHDIDKIGHTIVHPDKDEKLFIVIGKGVLNDDGKQYNMDMWLRFNKTNGTNLPRGIYKLNWLWSPTDSRPCPPLFSSSDSPWTFYVNVENAPSKSFCAVIGQILVTRSSKDLIEATMIINKVLKRVGGPPVQLPTIPVVGGLVGLASGQLVPEVPNFRVYIRWERD